MSIFVVILLPIFVVALVLALGGGRRPADASSRPWLKAALIVPVVLVSAMLLFGLFALFASRAVRVVAPAPRPLPQSYHMTTPAEAHGDLHRAFESAVVTHSASQHATVEADAGHGHAADATHGHGEHVAVEAEDHGTTPDLEIRSAPPAALPPPPPAALPMPSVPPQWLTALNLQDVAQEPHTSTETLYKFIVDRVATSVDKVSETGSPRRVVADKVSSELTNWLAHRISASANGTGPSEQPVNETRVRLAWQGRTERRFAWWPTPVVRGTLEARIAGPKGTAVVTAKLDEKPWLYERPEGSPNAQYAVVLSGEPEASAAQAVQSVRREAVTALYPHVRAELMSMSSGGRVPDATLRQHVMAAAQSNRGVVDECVVRVDRPYGPVWYAAQLREVMPHVVRPVAAAAVGATREDRQSFAAMILGLGGMTLVLGLLYLALNALTRGYFRGRLRVATAVAALLAGAVMLVLIG